MPAKDLSKINPRHIGNYRRSYDDIETTDDFKNRKEALEQAEFRAKIVGRPDSKPMSFGVGFADRVFGIFKDGYYGVRDIFAGKKVKTALTILGGIVIGAAAGAAIGTLVLPIFGTAGGAAAGAATGLVAAILPIVGGGIGLGIIGAVGGGWFGSFLSKKLYPNEHRYELSKRVTIKIKRDSDVRSKTAELMNGYLVNREKTGKNDFLKKLYKDLRKKAFFYAEPAAMEKAAHFFCQELILLKQEVDPSREDPALQEEINVVVTILESLATSKEFSQATSRKLEETLRDYQHEREGIRSTPAKRKDPALESDSFAPASKKKRAVQFSPHPAEILQGVKVNARQPLDAQQLKNVHNRFQASLKHAPYHIKHIDVREKNQERDTTTEFRCKLGDEQKVKIIFQQRQVAPQSFTSGVYVEKTKIKENQEIVTDMLIKGVAALQSVNQESGQHPILTIDAGGDDAVAIQLMTAALKARQQVQLDSQEYPDNPEMNARRKLIESEARRLANLQEAPREITPARKLADHQ